MRNAYLGAVVAGFLAGLAGAYAASRLERGGPAPAPLPSATAAGPSGVVAARRIELVDSGGRTRAILAMSPDGGPGLFFYDTAGRNRLVLGLYAPAESEFPFVVLNDTQQHAAGIFRLYGKEDPVVVLKSKGRDRSIYGLNAGSNEPFLVNYSGDGRKTAVFGSN